MTISTLTFHAAPPDGEWLNDPNALLWADGAYRLFAQHRADPPDYKRTGWARFSSPDLVRWTFDGAVIRPDGDRWIYSGSALAAAGGLVEAFHTEHEARVERQLRRRSRDAGLSWSAGEPVGPAPQRNYRDPFVFRHAPTNDWRMLLARPCDWTDWRDDASSELVILRADGHRRDWEEVGRIGPWAPKGVMWEVPLLVEVAGGWALIVSTVDRREDTARCGVRYWLGRFDGMRFERAESQPEEGRPLDLGPDFYAAMVSSAGGWPTMGPLLVGWLASWDTARHVPWPGFAGGPISIPRLLHASGAGAEARLHQHPAREVRGAFTEVVADVPVAGLVEAAGIAGDFRLTVEGDGAALTVTYRDRMLDVVRTGPDPLRWSAVHPTDDIVDRFAMFVDGPAVELLVEPAGQCCSVALPCGDRPFRIALESSRRSHPLTYRTLG